MLITAAFLLKRNLLSQCFCKAMASGAAGETTGFCHMFPKCARLGSAHFHNSSSVVDSASKQAKKCAAWEQEDANKAAEQALEQDMWRMLDGWLGEVMHVVEKAGARASDKLYAELMSKCGGMRCLPMAEYIHAHLAEHGLELGRYLGSGIVEMYVKCGSLVHARRFHDMLPQRNEFSWTALISGYADCGEGREALELFEAMQEEGVKPSSFTFVQALKACSRLGDLETGKKIHASLVGSRNESDVFVGNTLIDMYATCGSMVDAHHVFWKLPYRTVVSWTALMLGYVQEGECELALQLYAQMQREGVVPNDRTFVGALKACTSLATVELETQADGRSVKMGCLGKGRSIHSRAVKENLDSNLFVGTVLVDMYAKCGSMADARHVFDRMPHRDVVSWNVVILGYAQKEEGEVALQLYTQMQLEGVEPDDRTFIGALKACSSQAVLEKEAKVDGKLLKVRCLEKGRSIHCRLVKCGLESNAFVVNTLIDMYAKCGSMADARNVFDRFPSRDVVSWTAMILGYAEQQGNEEAFKLYAQMTEQGLSADSVTFVGILKACGNTAALESGKEVHSHVCRAGLEMTDLVIANALIDMYAKCGSMVNGQQLFDALPSRDLVTWSTLISGYARHGESEVVFHLLERMQREGIRPNSVTFLSVLTACSHVGLVDKGWEYFNAMREMHDLAPTIEHYNCMVDLLGRAGQIDNAVAMVENMPFKPNLVTWMTVLGACQKWTNTTVGRHAFECAVTLDARHAAAYVVMSNIYADAHMWEERDKIQAMRESAQAWKKPGQSWWTDISGTVHTFVGGDQTYIQRNKIYSTLKYLTVKTEKDRVPDPS